MVPEVRWRSPGFAEVHDDGEEKDERNWHSILEARILFGGIYHGWYRKVDGEWKIAKKIFLASPYPLDT